MDDEALDDSIEADGEIAGDDDTSAADSCAHFPDGRDPSFDLRALLAIYAANQVFRAVHIA